MAASPSRRSSTASTPCPATRPSSSPRTSSAGGAGPSTRSTASGSRARRGPPSRRPRRRRASGGRTWSSTRGRGRRCGRTGSCCTTTRWRGRRTWRGGRAGPAAVREVGSRAEARGRSRRVLRRRRLLGSSSNLRRRRGPERGGVFPPFRLIGGDYKAKFNTHTRSLYFFFFQNSFCFLSCKEGLKEWGG